MGDDRAVKRAYLGLPGGRRPVGRPKYRWKDQVEKDLRELGADDGRTGQPPGQQRFYRMFATILNFLGLGDRSWWGYKPIHRVLHYHGEFIYTVAPVCSITQFIYLYVNFENLTFDVIGTVLSITPVSILVNINIRSSRMDIYESVMKDFLKIIHLNSFCTEQDAFMKQKLKWIEQVTRFTAYYLVFFFGLNWVIWINLPVYNNFAQRDKIANKTMMLQTCVYMWMPFDYGYNFKNWTIIHVINVYVVGLGVMIMATLHCLNYIFIYHLIGHIQILKNYIRSSFVEELNDEEVKQKLVCIIKHHTFILRVFKDVQSAFGVNVAANYLHNLFSDSLILYQVFIGAGVMMYAVMIGAYMGELIIMSFVIEEIRKQSENLPEVIYNVPWESMSVPNQKIVLVILLRAQNKMEFTALGGLKAGVRPMVSILKTTFSYYLMLKELTGSQN